MNYSYDYSIGEIFNEVNGTFDRTNVQALLSAINNGDSSTTYADIKTLVTNGYEFVDEVNFENCYGCHNDRSNSYGMKEIVVTLGGLQWNVTFLEIDSAGTITMTLWLSNNVQSAWSTRSSTEGEYYGFLDSGLYAFDTVYASTSSNHVTGGSVQCNSDADCISRILLGNSYINAVVLNNGGTYYIPDTNTTATATKNSNSAFSLFTMENSPLYSYLCKRGNVQDMFWYEHGGYWSEDSQNDNLSTSTLWLPTASEVDPCEDNEDGSEWNYGTWGLYYTQLSNDNSVTWGDYTQPTGMVGTAEKSVSKFFRLGTPFKDYYDNDTRYYRGYGASFGGHFYDDDYYYIAHHHSTYHGITTSNIAYAIRPALTLNLTEVYESLDEQSNYVSIAEIFDENEKTFDENKVDALMKYISGNSSATISDLDTLAQTSSSYGTIYNGYSAGNMRTNSVSGGTVGGSSYGAKTSGQDIVVTLGGLKWQVEYLSKDKSGNTILTLWLDNCVQDAWTSRSSTEGEYYGFINGGLYSTWSYNWARADAAGNADYPSNMYGTSYMNAVVLNNGGYYATDTSTLSSKQAPSSSSVFALYTMSQYGLTDYLVAPRNVSWQESQSAERPIVMSYNLPNDAWSLDTPDTGFYPEGDEGSYNYAIIDESDDWADSYLWLPSMTETGRTTSYTGLWKTSKEQRKNYDGSTTSSLGTVGSTTSSNSSSTYADSWVRSGTYYTALYAYTLNPYGSYYTHKYVGHAYAVRPALHLNLTAVVNGVDNSTYVQVGELYDEETKSINYTNLDILAKYLTGNANATMDTTVWGSNSGFESFDCRDIRDITLDAGTYNGVAYSAKKGGQDVVVRLGGLDWYVVWNYSNDTCQYFTFYLKGGGQEKWLDTSKYTSTAGEYYGFIDGMLYGNYSANYQSTNVSGNYPSNMYGTSYLNSVILNNGGTYATSTTTSLTASQSSSNPFALYTMASGGLTKYLVKSSDSYHYNMGQSFVLKGSSNVSYDYSSTYVSKTQFHSNDSLRLEPNTYGTRLNSLINEKYRYYDKTGYANWGDGYLWIPSILETGYGNVASCWYLSESQQANGSLTDSFNIIGTVGTKGENAYASSWLRSAHNSRAYMAYTLLADGSGCGTSGVGSAHVIRPALHFNITAAEADRPSTASVSVESLGEKIAEANAYTTFNTILFSKKSICA